MRRNNSYSFEKYSSSFAPFKDKKKVILISIAVRVTSDCSKNVRFDLIDYILD